MAPNAEGWNHNTHYHDLLLSHVPARAQRALDVGCGRGGFARRLAEKVAAVDAIDRDPATLAVARSSPATVNTLRFHDADFLRWSPPEPYDCVSMIATLHHLPCADALAHARELLRPGGTLIVLGLHRAPTLLHAAVRSAVAFPVSRVYRLTRGFEDVGAPIAQSTLTLAEIRAVADRTIPGARIRTLLLWRCLLVWTAPTAAASPGL